MNTIEQPGASESEQRADQDHEIDGVRPGRFMGPGAVGFGFDGQEPTPNEAADEEVVQAAQERVNDETPQPRTDFSEDQPRDDHGRFAGGGVGLEGKGQTSGLGRPGGGAGPLHAKGEGGTAKGGGAASSIARAADPKEFHAAFEKQMKDSPFKAFVTHYTPEQLAAPDMKTLMHVDGSAGVAIHDHGDGRIEGTALWSTGATKGAGIAMLNESIKAHGVNYCECYAGTLDKMYSKLGFVETSRSPFNKEYASPDWDYKRFGTPDYVTMKLAS